MIHTSDDWEQLTNGIILFKGCTYVPPSLRETVLSQHHDSITSGHPGIKRTREQIECQYWWPDLIVDVTNYVQGCSLCQQVNPS